MREQRFLLLTFLVVAFLGGPAVYSVMREPLRQPTAEGTASENRVPASESSSVDGDFEKVHRNAIKAKSVTLELSCQGENQSHQTDGTLLRLKSDCWKSKIEKISVINNTNGFTAAVVETRSKGFTTDFIDLNEGDNNLEISGMDDKGRSVVKRMLVNRRTPASEIQEELPKDSVSRTASSNRNGKNQ